MVLFLDHFLRDLPYTPSQTSSGMDNMSLKSRKQREVKRCKDVGKRTSVFNENPMISRAVWWLFDGCLPTTTIHQASPKINCIHFKSSQFTWVIAEDQFCRFAWHGNCIGWYFISFGLLDFFQSCWLLMAAILQLIGSSTNSSQVVSGMEPPTVSSPSFLLPRSM